MKRQSTTRRLTTAITSGTALLALAATLGLGSTANAAGPSFEISFGNSCGVSYGSSHRRACSSCKLVHAPAAPCSRQWIRGRYEYRPQRVCVAPARWDWRHVGCDAWGNPRYERFHVPARYETRNRRVWIAGHWKTIVRPAAHGRHAHGHRQTNGDRYGRSNRGHRDRDDRRGRRGR